jgi:hypothetical protein
MPTLFGRNWTRAELLAHLSTMDAVAGIRLVESLDGRARGGRAFDVWTGSGLTFRVLIDRALDLSTFAFNGAALGWASSTGDVHPAYYEPEGLGWLRSFGGGMLATCGLDQFGAPSEDGEALGLHGRVGNLPAEYVSYRAYWDGDEYRLELSGEVRQTRVFGENFVLRRRISTALGSSTVRIEDTVTNESHAPAPHMILYHFNLGFPLIAPGASLVLDAEATYPRDAEAEGGMGTWNAFDPPTAGYKEQVFRHTPKAGADGRTSIGVDNPALGVGLRLTFDRAALPHVFQWKMMGAGMYVLGLEPANSSGIGGRADARAKGDLPMLAAGESRAYTLEVSARRL